MAGQSGSSLILLPAADNLAPPVRLLQIIQPAKTGSDSKGVWQEQVTAAMGSFGSLSFHVKWFTKVMLCRRRL